MSDHDRAPSRQESARQESERVGRNLHPMVYVALVGLVLWLVLAIWGFGYDGQTDYLLAIVTGFLIIAVAIPATLALMAYSQGNSVDGENSAPRDTKSFRQWAAEDFETWQDRVKGRNAAIEVLLPMAAIAIGMTAFAIILHFTAVGA
jgi:hypothetical protein